MVQLSACPDLNPDIPGNRMFTVFTSKLILSFYSEKLDSGQWVENDETRDTGPHDYCAHSYKVPGKTDATGSIPSK